MKCIKCSQENPKEAVFCMKCGTKLERKCPNCSAEYPEEAIFCIKCGRKLTDKDAVVEETAPEAPAPGAEAERRQLTVMFCDLVGSTPLSEQLDPEELREVIKAYQQVCSKVINRFEGHIARYFGDGLLVYFGYPIAHEDDAHRAVRTGLGIIEAIGKLNLRLQAEKNIKLAVRLGIHTGIVVAGDIRGEAGERLESMAVMGETPNLAARLQGLAEPDTLIISAMTYQLIRGFFDCQALGSQSLRGISQPIELYQVLHESTARSRLEVTATSIRGLTPLVGREQEVGLLIERWERVKEGMGQVVLLSGEAGIGKSRLTRVLKEEVAKEPHAWLIECRCSPYYINSAFYPIIDLLERVTLQFNREDTPEAKLGKLEGFLVQYGFPLEEVVPLFATLLSIPFGEGYSPLSLTPQQQKQKTLQAMLAMLLHRAAQQPVLLVVEDLHWSDPSTLEFLNLIIDQVATARILVVFTFRPDFIPSWTPRSYLASITLNRLAKKQVEVMVERITGGKSLPEEVLRELVSKTDGVPLFVEELTKMVTESGLLREEEKHYELTGPLPPLAIPTTLQDSLMARLDRLATVKEVAQLGAVIGREFSYELLSAVSPLDEMTLQRELGQLVEAELLYPRGIPPQAIYIFKHVLIQEAAYQSLLKSKRQQYHQRIAQVLEERFAEIKETQPELLAHHYTEAGLIVQAIPYWQKAGHSAERRWANLEAIAHLSKGLELLKTLPETLERDQQELMMQIALGRSLMAAKGYGSSEVEVAYVRARELCQKLGDTTQIFPVLFGLCSYYRLRGYVEKSCELAKEFVHLAQLKGDLTLLLVSHRVLGTDLLTLGEFASARKHLEYAISLYDPNQHRSLALIYSMDPKMAGLSMLSWTLWSLGYPDQALESSREAIALAQDLSHPLTLAYVLGVAAIVHTLCREEHEAQELAEAAIEFSTEKGIPLFLAVGIILRGWALSEQGQVEEGIAQMLQGLDVWRATGSEMVKPYFLSLLSKMHGKVGQIEKGLSVLNEALAVMEKNGDRMWEAELHRLKGGLLLMQAESRGGSRTAPTQQAETCFHQAIELARQRQAKSWELRATMSLCRLWQKQGKKEEARQILAEIYGWFTEGFDTKDLKEAKALLDELSLR